MPITLGEQVAAGLGLIAACVLASQIVAWHIWHEQLTRRVPETPEETRRRKDRLAYSLQREHDLAELRERLELRERQGFTHSAPRG